MTQATTQAIRDRRLVLAMLVLVYIFNFIDRQIVGILAIPIKGELGLTDQQLGLMGGLAFALFYTGLGIPIARLADRTSRTAVMTAALAVWSLFTAACGFVQNFTQLFLCRMGVGVGEAGGVAPAYALISDYFPKAERARAIAIYSLAIPIGSALGIFFGGWIASTVDWRVAFIVVGFAGVLLAPLFRLVVKEPPRGQHDGGVAPGGGPGLLEVAGLLAAKPSFWGMAFGAACSSIVGYGLIFWLPSFFTRSFDLTLFDAAKYYGALALVGGTVGTYAGGWLGDRLGGARKAWYCLVPAIAFLAAGPLYAAGMLSSSLAFAFPIFLIPTALALMWLGPVVAAIQHLVPASSRATASALFLFINNLIGIGFGTYFFGLVSDIYTARFGDEALRYAILTGLGFYAAAAALLYFASRHIERDWQG